MLKWYQEPLIHFLIIGILLFFITQSQPFSLLDNNSKKITIQKDEINKLISFWKKKYNTTPTQEELDTLLEVYIENEILYTEALNMKLDKHDEGVKKILVDKLKYIVSEPINFNKISDKELQIFFDKNKKMFSKNKHTTITFGHIYFNPKEHDSIEEKSTSMYQKVKEKDFNRTYASQGDPFYKGSHFSQLSKKEISSIFSHSFFQELQKLPKQTWSKPVASGYGIHLIYIENIQESSLTFNTLKEEIKNRYIIYKSKQNYENYYKKIKKKYKIHIAPYTLKNEK
ncbi:MAG: peptidyl-prolyl cis-trans isomerase [Sulfurovum sp.]|nr:peptidyl-prolyl cis-trans isomerase [Sulfurovum sp.]